MKLRRDVDPAAGDEVYLIEARVEADDGTSHLLVEPIEFLEKLAAIIPRAAVPMRAWTWAALMRRVADLDALARPRCGGRLRRAATVVSPAVAGTILAPRGLRHPADTPGPAPPSADLPVAAPAPQSSLPASGRDPAPEGRVVTTPRSLAHDRR